MLRAALWPTARVSRLAAAAATLALAMAPTVVIVIVNGRKVGNGLIVAFLLGGAALAWSVEDPVGEAFVALPVSSAARRGLRVMFVGLIVAGGLAVTVAVAAIGPGVPRDWVDRLPELAAATSVALAVGLVGNRSGERAPAAIGITAGVLGVIVIAALAMRWPTMLPRLAAGPMHVRWWAIAGAGALVAIWVGRDPGRR